MSTSAGQILTGPHALSGLSVDTGCVEPPDAVEAGLLASRPKTPSWAGLFGPDNVGGAFAMKSRKTPRRALATAKERMRQVTQ